MKTAKECNYSYAGEIGFIDLSKSKVTKEPTEKYAQKWIGGRAINTWILLDRLDPETR